MTDNAGVLSEAEKGKLVEAIQDVQRKEQRKIYVVFTEDFGGLSGEEWAKQAKQRNDGRNVLVYGVAVKSRDYGLAYGADWDSDADDMKKAAYKKLRGIGLLRVSDGAGGRVKYVVWVIWL